MIACNAHISTPCIKVQVQSGVCAFTNAVRFQQDDRSAESSMRAACADAVHPTYRLDPLALQGNLDNVKHGRKLREHHRLSTRDAHQTKVTLDTASNNRGHQLYQVRMS
jgi:hypothetical protein